MDGGSPLELVESRDALRSHSRELAGLSRPELLLATERVVAFLLNQRLEERASTDGRRVGIQSAIALSTAGEDSIELYELVDGIVAAPAAGAAEARRVRWQHIASKVEAQLGFPLEPELFSNMLFVAYAGGVRHHHVRRMTNALLATFRRSDARGLYHFFTSLRFAGDIDCTGVAARARLLTGDIDLGSAAGANELRQITDRILRSAAVADVPSEQNRSHNKENGPLVRHVFKVYLDDHELQGAAYDRGLKNNPAVVANALFPVLFELAAGTRDPSEIIPLKEYSDPESAPRIGSASVAELVVANLRYIARYLQSGEYRKGCRYYGAPDSFLCFYSELIRTFGPMAAILGAPTRLSAAIRERRRADTEGIDDPHNSLNTALRAIAAANVGIDNSPELRSLIDRQSEEGHWTDFGALYSFGSSHAHKVYFGSAILTAGFALRAFSADEPLLGKDLRRDPLWNRVLRELLVVSNNEPRATRFIGRRRR